MGSVIFPAGANKYDWIPKLAEDERIGVDALSDAELADLVQEPTDIDVADAVLGDEGEEPEIDAVEVSIEGEMPEEELEVEPVTLEEAAEEAAEKLEEAQEAIADVIELAIGDDGEIDFEEEVVDEEVDGEEEAQEIADEEALEGALEAVTPGEPDEDVEKEGCKMCGETAGVAEAATEEPEITVAGDDRRFIRIAALTPENREKVRKYWVESLGYDKKYVDWMVKDYEK
jgi:hypothetical protein